MSWYLQYGYVLLFEDETVLRFLPPLRSAWGKKGEEIRVPISGENAKRVLFGAINPKTGHRIVHDAPRNTKIVFQAFLAEIRRRYRGRKLLLVLDRGPSHGITKQSTTVKEEDIEFLWLPKQWPELNLMDQLWRHLKTTVAANRQYRNIDQLVTRSKRWILDLSSRQALQKVGIYSKACWLKKVL